MVELISAGTRKARKPHQCFHCRRFIGIGGRYGYQTNLYDGAIYTLSWHLDCEECANEVRGLSFDVYDDEGWGPLRDEWLDSGEYEAECDAWRGFYPHVVARMELTDQLIDEQCSPIGSLR